MAVICSFNYDEPVAAIVEAARRLPDVRFLMTGNPHYMAPALGASLPSNVSLTGFLSVPAYGGLLAGADVVMSLTTRDHTMSRGAYEAIYQGTPVIVSDWPLLRAAFDSGAAHVDNSVDGIVSAIRAVRASVSEYRAGAAQLRTRKRERWQATKHAIVSRIAPRRRTSHYGATDPEVQA